MRLLRSVMILWLVPLILTPLSTTPAYASAPAVITVEISCFGFSNYFIEVHNGDTVRFVHNDTCGNFPHTITSTGTSGVQDFEKPQPSSPLVGHCFDSPFDMQSFITEDDPIYELDLDIVNGIAVRNWQQPDERTCVGSNGVLLDGANNIMASVPFHCRIHGGDQATGEGMRAVLIIRA